MTWTQTSKLDSQKSKFRLKLSKVIPYNLSNDIALNFSTSWPDGSAAAWPGKFGAMVCQHDGYNSKYLGNNKRVAKDTSLKNGRKNVRYVNAERPCSKIPKHVVLQHPLSMPEFCWRTSARENASPGNDRVPRRHD